MIEAKRRFLSDEGGQHPEDRQRQFSEALALRVMRIPAIGFRGSGRKQKRPLIYDAERADSCLMFGLLTES